MAIWQYDLVAVPREPINSAFGGLPAKIRSEVFDSRNWWSGRNSPDETELLALLPRSDSWSDSIRAWGTCDGNRIELHFDEEVLFEIRVRIDLREPSRRFVEGIIELAVRHGWVFWTEEMRLLEANLGVLVSDITRSRAYAFVRNPSAFLEWLNKQQLE